ncbi:MAG: 50S ribosomal protein L11 methyltransferase [Rubrobacteridae bacterium]|nr:50S ribosomal protein L11 methyltransferase [Rubrobacteridae bacterium]
MQDVIKGDETVLDIGTGSGILAVVAAKIGASQVIAIDNDPVAIDVAIENAVENRVESNIRFETADIKDFKCDAADIVVANITAPVIVSMLPDLVANVENIKTLIAAGTMCEQKDSVVEALANNGFSIENEIERNNWITLVGRRG